MSHSARMGVAQAMTTLIDCWPSAENTNYESEVHGFLGKRFTVRLGTRMMELPGRNLISWLGRDPDPGYNRSWLGRDGNR